MTAENLFVVFACAAELTLAVLCFSRGARNPLALPLALLSVDFFVWNFATLAYTLSGHDGWRWLDVTASPLTTPFALHFVAVFVGRRRPLGWLLWSAYAAFGALSAATAASYFAPSFRWFAGSSTSAVLHLAGVVPCVALGVALLALHVARTTDLTEPSARRCRA